MNVAPRWMLVALALLAGCFFRQARRLERQARWNTHDGDARVRRARRGPPARGTTGAAGMTVTPVGETPPATWTNVTANLAGMASECGNTPYLTAHPASDMLITSVAKQGLWSSTDGGASWTQLWPAAGTQQISNRGSSIVFDPAHADTFWESGIYNGPGVYRTTDNGATFTPLGDARHIDSVSVDFADPQRQTLLAGGHEQKQTLYRSADGVRDLDQRRPEPARRHELLHERPGHRQEHSPGRLLGYAGRTDGVFRPPTAATPGRRRRAHRRPPAVVALGRHDLLVAHLRPRPHQETDQGRTWMQPSRRCSRPAVPSSCPTAASSRPGAASP